MLEITCKKKQIFGQAFSKGFRDGISWYLADLSKAQGKQEGETAFEESGSRGDLAEKGLMPRPLNWQSQG